MLKLFFNKKSPVVYAAEAIGVALFVILIVDRWPSEKTIAQQVVFYIYIFEYLFIRLFASIKWYKNAERYEGIELQFKKAMVPASYIIAIFNLILLVNGPVFLLYIAIFLLTIFAHVNVILIYFYIKDKESLPINYFTHGKYLKT